MEAQMNVNEHVVVGIASVSEANRRNRINPSASSTRTVGTDQRSSNIKDVMTQRFDVVAIGTGSAASSAAWAAHSAGRRTAVIDWRPFGGTCALRGCDPKKVLVGAAETLDRLQRMENKGLDAQAARIDWPALMRFERTFTRPVPEAREKEFAQAGIATLHGRARFLAPRKLRVGSEKIEADYFVIATGARPRTLRFPGAEHLITSEQFLELDALPRHIAFVGGGYISFEFAHVAIRAGAEVAILHSGPRPLELFDPDLVEVLVTASRGRGINVKLESPVERVERGPDGFTVYAAGGVQIQADLVVHGAGRVPDIGDLGLEEANVEHGPRGVVVNEFLQSVSNPAVYAAGDVSATAGPPLTPVAGYEGSIVAANILEGNRQKPDYAGIPSVAFTIPNLAAVGLGVQAATERKLKFRVNHQSTETWYSSRRTAEMHTGFKVLVEEGTGKILGAHLLGAQAEELINIFAMAIRLGLSASDLKRAIFAYPSHASDLSYML
jgi:glutathione reductase (NADPH)